MGRRIGQGARLVVPVSVVVNIFQEGSGSDNVKDRKAIAAGDYNKENSRLRAQSKREGLRVDCDRSLEFSSRGLLRCPVNSSSATC